MELLIECILWSIYTIKLGSDRTISNLKVTFATEVLVVTEKIK